MNTRPAIFICTLLISGPAVALENFMNSMSPYPSGCVTINATQPLYPGGTQAFWSEEIAMTNNRGDEGAALADVSFTRTGCAEEGRSFISMEVSIRDDHDGENEFAIMPEVFARIGFFDYPFRLVKDPSSWLEDNVHSLLEEGSSHVFILDVPQPVTEDFNIDTFLIPSEYNGAFTLVVRDILGSEETFEVSAYDNSLQPSLMPLNGRLSGIWVVEEASDQGFVISFSEIPGLTAQGLIFFSWYTFNQDGQNIWLVGNANYLIGAASVSFALEVVTDGDFLGSKIATRIPAGTVSITARECNLLELEYDLQQIGLGQNTVSVSRLFGIETAGYTCMDIENRLE